MLDFLQSDIGPLYLFIQQDHHKDARLEQVPIQGAKGLQIIISFKHNNFLKNINKMFIILFLRFLLTKTLPTQWRQKALWWRIVKKSTNEGNKEIIMWNI